MWNQEKTAISLGPPPLSLVKAACSFSYSPNNGGPVWGTLNSEETKSVERYDISLKLWPPDAKKWLIWKDTDAGKDWKWEEKGMTEDKMVYRWLNEQEFE